MSEKPRSGRPQKVSDAEFQELLDRDSAQTQQQLAEKLGITQQGISEILQALGKIQKHGRWVPHELTQEQCEERVHTYLSLLSRQKRKSFLWKLPTGDEKWIHFENPKCQKHWVYPGQPRPTPKRDVFGKKLPSCIRWDEWRVLYAELLKPGESVTGEHYTLRLNRLAE